MDAGFRCQREFAHSTRMKISSINGKDIFWSYYYNNSGQYSGLILYQHQHVTDLDDNNNLPVIISNFLLSLTKPVTLLLPIY